MTRPITTGRAERLCAFVVAVVILGACMSQHADTPARTTTTPVTSEYLATSVDALAAGRWSSLPVAPIPPRDTASVVWTGRELLVWGGRAARGALLGDGAAYDPTTGRWRLLARAPLSPREGQAAVWTGREMVVWGGYDAVSPSTVSVVGDGAAYRPDTDSWRPLPRSPLTPRTNALAIWTGRQVVVLGGQGTTSVATGDGAGYDPSRNRWNHIPAPVPPVGHPLSWGAAAQANGEVLAWSNWTTDNHGGADLFVYRERTGRWRSIAHTSGEPAAVEDVYWTGRIALPARAVMSTCGLCLGLVSPPTMHAYDPAHNVWTPLPSNPLENVRVVSVWTGAALLSFQAQIGEIPPPPVGTNVYDPATMRWSRLADAPSECGWYATPVWTGRQLLAYCPRSASNPARDGLAFTVP